jgi:hypothetical protein
MSQVCQFCYHVKQRACQSATEAEGCDSSWNVPDEYVGIRAWGKVLGSYDYYIEQEQRRAVRMRAPLDAIYLNSHNDVWVCVSDLSPTHSFHEVYRRAIEARQAQLRG